MDGCAFDTRVHGETHPYLAHVVITIDYQHGAKLFDNTRDAFRIDTLAREFSDVIRDAKHAVRVNASKVRLDERVGDCLSGIGKHAAGSEYARNTLAQDFKWDSGFVLATWVACHRNPSWETFCLQHTLAAYICMTCATFSRVPITDYHGRQGYQRRGRHQPFR